jgi:hypothetical protein
VYTTKFMAQRGDNKSLDDEMVDRRRESNEREVARGRVLEKTEGVHDKVHGTQKSDHKSSDFGRQMRDE